MKEHTLIDASMLDKLEHYKDEKMIKIAYQICRWHHERWDGKGYPDGLKGEEIPIQARIVAVADRYFGLIPNRELYRKCRLGEVLKVRVTKVREDGKMDLSLREVAYRQMNADAEAVLARLKEKNGVLPFNDRVEPEIIRREFNLSKNAFKRAVGHLLKEGKVEVNEDSIRLK